MSLISIEALYAAKLVSVTRLFEHLFSADEMYQVFLNKHSKGTAKGLDRCSGQQYKRDARAELAIASKKCINGTFRFTPYLEALRPKGREKPPRLIGIPTIRDRVILGQLHRFLKAVFPEAVPRQISGAYVRKVADGLTNAPPDTWICGTDIKTFYDSIQRDRLESIVRKRVDLEAANILLSNALRTPTIPKNAKREDRKNFATKRGVPQGLAISNILASIYMSTVDQPMAGADVTYVRYVDDVLMYGAEDSVRKAHRSLTARLRRRGLSLHTLTSNKTTIQPIGRPFDYLGYRFCIPKITVRESTVERFIQSIASKFSEFKYSKSFKLSRYNFLTAERLRDIFLLELNEKITGAISENKRYGWVAYFSQINDHTLLYRMDHMIAAMFSRVGDFDYKPPHGLKRISRAFWEMKFRPEGSYIRNYDRISTVTQKLEFLISRGKLDPKEVLTNEQVEDRFQAYVSIVLADMHADEGAMY